MREVYDVIAHVAHMHALTANLATEIGAVAVNTNVECTMTSCGAIIKSP